MALAAPHTRTHRSAPAGRHPASCSAPHLSRAGVSVRACAQQSTTRAAVQQQPGPASSRRAALLAVVATAAAALPGSACADGEQPVAAQEAIKVVQEAPGFGQHGVRQGELVLVHYTGTVAETGEVFDTTRGGLKYRDGGPGVFRPAAFRLNGAPTPGICLGLQQAVEGMRIGGTRTVLVPSSLGFGREPALAPFAIVPAGATLQYEVELLRVSAVGPDMLMKGISRCSAGGAAAAADNCANIEPAEFF